MDKEDNKEDNEERPSFWRTLIHLESSLENEGISERTWILINRLKEERALGLAKGDITEV